jgi:hypothetical protein
LSIRGLLIVPNSNSNSFLDSGGPESVKRKIKFSKNKAYGKMIESVIDLITN